MAHPGGRPPIFNTTDEMQGVIDSFFADKDTVKTICGLAIALGFSSRGTIYEYEKKPEFSDIIKTAMLKVENEYEKRSCSNNPTGAIFILKNMGWSDRQEVDQTHHFPDEININFTSSSKDDDG